MNIIKFWYKNARPTALPQSVLPAILAVCMALHTPGFSVWLAILAVAGVIAGHLGMNLFDDYFDYCKKGADYRDKLARAGIRSRIAKCSYLTSGNATVIQLLLACFLFCILSIVLGTVIYFYRGEFIVWIALATAALGISYSGAPLRLSYHGLGELGIGLIFGPLLMMGVYYSAAGAMDWAVLFISFPVGLLVTNIVYTHSIMDYEPDKEAGKITLAVLLRKHAWMLVILFIMLFVPYVIVVAGVVTGYLHMAYLAVLLTLHMACGLFYLMVQFVRDPHRAFVPRYWMGPMGNWKRMKSAGIEWFMIRWLLARNLLSFFCLVVIIVSLVA